MDDKTWAEARQASALKAGVIVNLLLVSRGNVLEKMSSVSPKIYQNVQFAASHGCEGQVPGV